MATHSSVLASRIPWTEEPGGQQCMGSRRVGHEWVTSHKHLSFGEAVLMFDQPQGGAVTINIKPGGACHGLSS